MPRYAPAAAFGQRRSDSGLLLQGSSFQDSSAGRGASSLTLPSAQHGLAVTGVVAIQILVIVREAGGGEAVAGVARLAVPLIEAEPVVLAGHGVAVVVDLLATEVGFRAEDPQVHHDLGGLVRNRRVPVVAPHRLAIHVPGDAVGQPFESVGVELGPRIALDVGLLHRGNRWPPPLCVVRAQHIGRHRVGRVASDLDVNLPPVVELGVAENEHGGDEVPVHIGSSRLHIWCLHAHLIAPVAEDVPTRPELAAHQRLLLDGPHLGMGAGLRGIARVGLCTDLHLSALESDLLLHEAHVAFVEAAVRPGPDRIVVQVQWAVELFHQRQREPRVAWVALAGVRMSGHSCDGSPSGRRSTSGRWCPSAAAGNVRAAVAVVLALAVALAPVALNVCRRTAVLLAASPR